MEWMDCNGPATEAALDDSSVLIVDDDGDYLLMSRLCLMAQGFKVTCAASGAEALALLKSSPFCLMLTDYNMPDMDGLRLSEEALKAAPGLTIVMVTGDPVVQLTPIAAESGVCAVLSKPLDIEALLKIVHAEREQAAYAESVSNRPL